MSGIRWNNLRAWIKVARDLPARRGHYPDGPFAALTCAFCKAAEQPTPGTFQSVAVLHALLDATGQKRGRHLRYLIDRGDVVVGKDGQATLPNWQRFQEEGTSTPRVRKHRMERSGNADVTLNETGYETPMEHDETLLAPFHETPMERLAGAPPRRDSLTRVEPSLRSGEPSIDGKSPSGEKARADLVNLGVLIQELTGWPFGHTPGSKVWERMAQDVAQLGAVAVDAAYREIAAQANGQPIDAAGIVFGAHNGLFPIPSPAKPAKPSKGMGPTTEEADHAFGRS